MKIAVVEGLYYYRGWIAIACMGQLTGKSRDELFFWYDRACKVIELGRAEWPDVDREERGTIFDDTFLRGVQVRRLNAYMQVNSLRSFHIFRKMTYFSGI